MKSLQSRGRTQPETGPIGPKPPPPEVGPIPSQKLRLAGYTQAFTYKNATSTVAPGAGSAAPDSKTAGKPAGHVFRGGARSLRLNDPDGTVRNLSSTPDANLVLQAISRQLARRSPVTLTRVGCCTEAAAVCIRRRRSAATSPGKAPAAAVLGAGAAFGGIFAVEIEMGGPGGS